MKEADQKPSDGELEILQELWAKPGQTVQEIHSRIELRKKVGYTTTLKQIQRMFEKKMVSRTKETKSFIYFAILDETTTKNSIFNRLTKTLFKGSSKEMMLHLLGNQTTSKEELSELKKWIEQQENKDK